MQGAQAFTHMGQIGAAIRGQREIRAAEQARSQNLLQLLDPVADGAGRDAQLLRRQRDRAQPRQSLEGEQALYRRNPPGRNAVQGAGAAGHMINPKPRDLAEHHGLVTVENDAALAMPLHGTGQNLALGVAATGRQVLHGVGMVGACHVLLYDRAFVEVGRHIVGGGTDQLHAAVMRLVVGLGALEAGQEAVVDIDGAAGQLFAQVVGQYLHVARQHHQLGTFFLNDLVLALFGLGLGRGSHGNVMKGDVVAGRQLIELAVVADDGLDLDGQQARLPAEQQVVEAVAFLADHDDGLDALGLGVQTPLHLILIS
ncbi:hypothetical protein SDC9_120046 [bioreactor metagenome]|uniref:Uncharacterized protein n=1 Tax=bioreactor metagenome TaxID=1076179 RepID=A0A645C5M6_9ZZZZ